MGIFTKFSSFFFGKTAPKNSSAGSLAFSGSMPEELFQELSALAQKHSDAFMEKLKEEQPNFSGGSSDIQYIANLLHDEVLASFQNEQVKNYICEGTTLQALPELHRIAPIQVPPAVTTYKYPSPWVFSAFSAAAACLCFICSGLLGFGSNTSVGLFFALIGAIVSAAVGVWLTFGETRVTWGKSLLGITITGALLLQLQNNFSISAFWKGSSSKSILYKLGLAILLWFLLGMLKRKKVVDTDQLHLAIHSQYLNQLCSIVSFLKMTCVRIAELEARISVQQEELERRSEQLRAQGDLPKYASQAIPDVQGLWKTTSISQAAAHAKEISQYFSLMGFANIPAGTRLPWEPEDPERPAPNEYRIITWDPTLESKYETIGLVLDGEKVEVHSEPIELNGIVTQKGVVYSLD
ncbi:MAG: hypothetical protein IJD43_04785 [Thermoguttaceae bacterium]|nr:hypothetical protein [Thermoguttaceae bacterium]